MNSVELVEYYFSHFHFQNYSKKYPANSADSVESINSVGKKSIVLVLTSTFCS